MAYSQGYGGSDAYGQLESDDPANHKRCNCKKAKCLKLYCVCFSAGVYCGGCACRDCMNTMQHQDTVWFERQRILQRSPRAFAPKVEQKMTGDVTHKKGCRCRKSRCLKKYCECFDAGVHCSVMCRCDDCHNQPEDGDGPVGGGSGSAMVHTRGPSASLPPLSEPLFSAAQSLGAADAKPPRHHGMVMRRKSGIKAASISRGSSEPGTPTHNSRHRSSSITDNGEVDEEDGQNGYMLTDAIHAHAMGDRAMNGGVMSEDGMHGSMHGLLGHAPHSLSPRALMTRGHAVAITEREGGMRGEAGMHAAGASTPDQLMALNEFKPSHSLPCEAPYSATLANMLGGLPLQTNSMGVPPSMAPSPMGTMGLGMLADRLGTWPSEGLGMLAASAQEPQDPNHVESHVAQQQEETAQQHSHAAMHRQAGSLSQQPSMSVGSLPMRISNGGRGTGVSQDAVQVQTAPATRTLSAGGAGAREAPRRSSSGLVEAGPSRPSSRARSREPSPFHLHQTPPAAFLPTPGAATPTLPPVLASAPAARLLRPDVLLSEPEAAQQLAVRLGLDLTHQVAAFKSAQILASMLQMARENPIILAELGTGMDGPCASMQHAREEMANGMGMANRTASAIEEAAVAVPQQGLGAAAASAGTGGQAGDGRARQGDEWANGGGANGDRATGTGAGMGTAGVGGKTTTAALQDGMLGWADGTGGGRASGNGNGAGAVGCASPAILLQSMSARPPPTSASAAAAGAAQGLGQMRSGNVCAPLSNGKAMRLGSGSFRFAGSQPALPMGGPGASEGGRPSDSCTGAQQQGSAGVVYSGTILSKRPGTAMFGTVLPEDTGRRISQLPILGGPGNSQGVGCQEPAASAQGAGSVVTTTSGRVVKRARMHDPDGDAVMMEASSAMAQRSEPAAAGCRSNPSSPLSRAASSGRPRRLGAGKRYLESKGLTQRHDLDCMDSANEMEAMQALFEMGSRPATSQDGFGPLPPTMPGSRAVGSWGGDVESKGALPPPQAPLQPQHSSGLMGVGAAVGTANACASTSQVGLAQSIGMLTGQVA